SFFFSSRRRHTRSDRDWSSDVCSSDLRRGGGRRERLAPRAHERRSGCAAAGGCRALRYACNARPYLARDPGRKGGRTLVKRIIMNHGDISPEIAKGLKVLQSRIANAKIPSSKLDETLNIATWNIREFGKKERSEAAIHYIAEILGEFDLISIAELRDNLTDLGRVLEVLGPTWRVIYSDALRDSGGNNERVGFVYDKRAVAFSGFAATANPPREKVGNLYLPKFDWWREPFMASFSAGSFDFVLLAG